MIEAIQFFFIEQCNLFQKGFERFFFEKLPENGKKEQKTDTKVQKWQMMGQIQCIGYPLGNFSRRYIDFLGNRES